MQATFRLMVMCSRGSGQERRFPHCLAVSRRAAAPFRMRMCVRRRMSLARRVYFALQVIDGAFAGGSGRSRVHLRLGKAEITLDADGNAQTSGISYEVQAAGQYQPDGYNGDYVLEAAIICPAPLFTEDIAASIWFTDGKGDKSRVCELTIPLDIPAPSASESVLPQPDSPSVRPQPSTQADQTKQPSTQNNTHAEASHSSRPLGRQL